LKFNKIQNSIELIDANKKLLYRYANIEEYQIIENLDYLEINLDELYKTVGYVNIDLTCLNENIKLESYIVKITPIQYNLNSSSKTKIALSHYLNYSKGKGGNIVGFFDFDYLNNWRKNYDFFSCQNNIQRNFILLDIDSYLPRSTHVLEIKNIGLESSFDSEPNILKIFKAGILMSKEGLLEINKDVDRERLDQITTKDYVNESEVNFVGDLNLSGYQIDFDYDKQVVLADIKQKCINLYYAAFYGKNRENRSLFLGYIKRFISPEKSKLVRRVLIHGTTQEMLNIINNLDIDGTKWNHRAISSLTLKKLLCITTSILQKSNVLNFFQPGFISYQLAQEVNLKLFDTIHEHKK